MSFRGLGELLVQPALNSVPKAPVLNQQQQQRVGPWGNFMQKLNSDPNMRMALLQAGLAMMRGNRPGETGFDIFSDAALRGLQSYDTLNQRDRSQGLEERQIRNQERQQQALIDQGAARVRQGDERIGVEREALAQRANEAEQRQANADRNYQLALKQLEATQAAGESTGQERMLDTVTNAVMQVAPNLYQGDEGRAQAQLKAMDIINGRGDPERRAGSILQLTQMLMRNAQIQMEAEAENAFMERRKPDFSGIPTLEDIQRHAVGFYNAVVGEQEQRTSATNQVPASGQFNGQSANFNGDQVKFIFDPADGKYRVFNSRGAPAKERLTEEQVRILMNTTGE